MPRPTRKPALLDPQGQARDLSGVIDDIRAETLAPAGLQSLPIIATPVRIGVPFGSPGKFICVGLNYADHVAETGAEVPKEPILFSKWFCPTGANDPIVLPRQSLKTDGEVELGDIIGTGTPPGVGMGQKPPVYLQPGDEVRLGIAGLGEQTQRVYAWDAALLD